MLHRLALRVLPRLSRAVTEEQVRKRKRWVMLVPGLAAFAVYRLVKQIDPLSDPFVLLGLSGLISATAALWAFRMGRREAFAMLWREDGPARLAWLAGWIGFVYGVQLSLMVLALLKVLPGSLRYDFLYHPHGPAMMAIIIACTSVARDAFEIGHVRRLQRQGESFLTFPDGAALRALIREHPVLLLQWALLAGASGALTAIAVTAVGDFGRTELGQLTAVGVVAGILTVAAYLRGEQRLGQWWRMLGTIGWMELFRFWWWPGLAFAVTYYLVLSGGVYFLFGLDPASGFVPAVMAGLVAGLMAVYGYYLGYRRCLENRIEHTVPPSLLRCPFVFGILSKSKRLPAEDAVPPAGVVLEEGGGRRA